MKLKTIPVLLLFICILIVAIVFLSVGVNAQGETSKTHLVKLDEYASILISEGSKSPKVWVNMVEEENDITLEYLSMTEKMKYDYPDYNWDEILQNSYSHANLSEIDNLAAMYLCIHCDDGKGFMAFEGLVRKYEMGETVPEENYDDYIMGRYLLEYGDNFTRYVTQNGQVGINLDRFRYGIHVSFIYPHKESKRIYSVSGMMYTFTIDDEMAMDKILETLTSLTFDENEYSDELYNSVDTSDWKAIVLTEGV